MFGVQLPKFSRGYQLQAEDASMTDLFPQGFYLNWFNWTWFFSHREPTHTTHTASLRACFHSICLHFHPPNHIFRRRAQRAHNSCCVTVENVCSRLTLNLCILKCVILNLGHRLRNSLPRTHLPAGLWHAMRHTLTHVVSHDKWGADLRLKH